MILNRFMKIVRPYYHRECGLSTILDLEPEANKRLPRSEPLDKEVNVNVKLPCYEGVNNLLLF